MLMKNGSFILQSGGVAQWVASLTHTLSVVNANPSKAPVVSLTNQLYPHCLVLVCSMNEFECNFASIALVKYCQNNSNSK